jgi:hypothetical protein
MRGAIPPLPIRLHGRGAQLKHRDDFTIFERPNGCSVRSDEGKRGKASSGIEIRH